jgi:acyl-CoA thioesterase FadM
MSKMPPALFESHLMDLQPGWIDYNEHLNMAYYNVLFDIGCEAVWDWIGFGTDYLEKTNHTTYAVEFRIRYLRELKLGDRVKTLFRVVDFDQRKFHHFAELRHEDGWLAAVRRPDARRDPPECRPSARGPARPAAARRPWAAHRPRATRLSRRFRPPFA